MARDSAGQRPFFSIIMPTYNRQPLLDEAVRSVVEQKDQDWELFVIDDASPTPAQVIDDPRVKLLRLEQNGGFSAAANAGLSNAQGEVVAFLGDDDAWTTDRLSNAKIAHLAGADVAVCGSVTMTGGEDQSGHEGASYLMLSPGDSGDGEMLGSMGAISVRRRLCPALNEEFRACEDIEWSIRLWDSQPLVARVQSNDFLWRKHSGTRNKNGTEVRIILSERLLELHRSYYSRNPSKKAYRLFRMGSMHLQNDRRLSAARLAIKSLRVRPNRYAFRLLIRSALPSAVTLGRQR